MTIFALSTGPGISGVSVIRISGQETSKVIKALTGKDLPKPRVATLRKINKINTSELIDEGLMLWFPGPESYTGEDMAEIHVHGGKAIVLALQNELSKIENFRLAEPGEFTKIAFQNGKINLLKAESISDLIAAETEMQRLQAVKIMEGKSAEKFDDLREKLLKILSFVEAKIDFPEEDLPEENLKKIKQDSSNVLSEINKILNDQKVGEIIREGFKIAIIGLGYVGLPLSLEFGKKFRTIGFDISKKFMFSIILSILGLKSAILDLMTFKSKFSLFSFSKTFNTSQVLLFDKRLSKLFFIFLYAIFLF